MRASRIMSIASSHAAGRISISSSSSSAARPLDQGLADGVALVADQEDPPVRQERQDHDGPGVDAHLPLLALAGVLVLQVVDFEPDFPAVVDDLLVNEP